MASFAVATLTTLALAFVIPGEGPVNKKQFRRTLKQLRACASSANPAPGGPIFTGSGQYAELMNMELRGLEKKKWESDEAKRAFQFEKKAAFGQRYRFDLRIENDRVDLMRIMVDPRGNRSAYGVRWQSTRLTVFPLREQCAEKRCTWERSTEIEMTCTVPAVPAK
ncbi:MAG: hypothetical protein AAF658_04515 [Myxococcota bacterium]